MLINHSSWILYTIIDYLFCIPPCVFEESGQFSFWIINFFFHNFMEMCHKIKKYSGFPSKTSRSRSSGDCCFVKWNNASTLFFCEENLLFSCSSWFTEFRWPLSCRLFDFSEFSFLVCLGRKECWQFPSLFPCNSCFSPSYTLSRILTLALP